MSYLLDTNVISELADADPEIRVVEWFYAIPDDALHLSVLSLGELRKGVELLETGHPRKEKLRLWLEHDLPDWFQQRILEVDQGVADRWGRLVARIGRPVAAIDGLLAATALHHGLRMITCNERDFLFPGLDVINPWRSRRF